MLNHPVLGDRVRIADIRLKAQLGSEGRLHCFDTEDLLVYVPFCDDFGPMNLSSVIRFIRILEHKLAEFPDRCIVYCCENEMRKLTNAVFLLGAFMVVKMDLNPDTILSSFADVAESLVPYRDASHLDPDFHLSLLDCWRGLARAKLLGWVDKYDLSEYEHYDNPLEGDMHELLPDKLFAFRGPKTLPANLTYRDEDGYRIFSPSFYIEPFGDLNIKTVVRLNEREYEDTEFTEHGIHLVNLEFEDCSSPPANVIVQFLHTVRTAPGAVAVHCRAGLGRTGTLAALYMMTTYDFSAREAIAWLRIVRPGSVIGEQQHFLRTVEEFHVDICASIARTPAAASAAHHSTSSILKEVKRPGGIGGACSDLALLSVHKGWNVPRRRTAGWKSAASRTRSLTTIPEENGGETCSENEGGSYCGCTFRCRDGCGQGRQGVILGRAELRLEVAARISASARFRGRETAKTRLADARRGGALQMPALNEESS